jgi:hypothetical protein
VGNGVVGLSVQPAKPAKRTAAAILQIHVNVVIASIPNAKVAAKARQRRCLWTLFPRTSILVNTAQQFKDIPKKISPEDLNSTYNLIFSIFPRLFATRFGLISVLVNVCRVSPTSKIIG